MTVDFRGLQEIKSAGTAAYSVWVDRTGLGCVFYRMKEPGQTDNEWVCVSAGQAILNSFVSRTDLPVGTRIIATDRVFSTWTYRGQGAGLGWAPEGRTGVLVVTANRFFGAGDYNATLASVSGVARTLTLITGNADGYQVTLAQGSTGKIFVQPGANITILTKNNSTGTSGQGAIALLTKVQTDQNSGVETYMLTGDVN